MTAPLHIGVLGTGLIGWGGGIDLLRIVLGALAHSTAGRNFKLSLLLPGATAPVSRWAQARALAAAVFSRRPIHGLRHFYWELQSESPAAAAQRRLLATVLPGGAAITTIEYVDEHDLRRTVRRRRIDVVLPSLINLGPDFPVPWGGYIPDFQHCHLPHMFDDAERVRRDRSFGQMLRDAPVMIVTSESAKRDALAFLSGRDPRPVVVLPFSPYPHRDWFDGIVDDVRALYALPLRYFLVSSQFWRHKSHITAIRALALLRKSEAFADVKLVCTGATDDFRHPGYFESLVEQVKTLGLMSDVLILGHIPKRHQIEILKAAVSLIQPTLFEGTQGGLAVYDAVGVGVRAIVSDLPVNMEITDPLVRFFEAENSQELANQMKQALVESTPTVSATRQMALADQRMDALGQELLRAADLLRGAVAG